MQRGRLIGFIIMGRSAVRLFDIDRKVLSRFNRPPCFVDNDGNKTNWKGWLTAWKDALGEALLDLWYGPQWPKKFPKDHPKRVFTQLFLGLFWIAFFGIVVIAPVIVCVYLVQFGGFLRSLVGS